MRIVWVVITTVSTITMAAFGLLALVAFSDANNRCPGIQCNDAISAGACFTLIALTGLAIAVFGYRSIRALGSQGRDLHMP